MLMDQAWSLHVSLATHKVQHNAHLQQKNEHSTFEIIMSPPVATQALILLVTDAGPAVAREGLTCGGDMSTVCQHLWQKSYLG